jgi:primary-amine oxidase
MLVHIERVLLDTDVISNSFFLTPLNYFDYDISIDSTNAILLTAPETPGDAYKYDDYGVKPVHCVPEAPPLFEYEGMEIHDRDGYPAPPMGVEDIRKMTQMYHRILVEL